MQDLTGKFTAALSPSSMSAGNTTADDRAITQSAPGSASVLPVPDRMDNLPMPAWTNAEPIPLGHPGQQQKASSPARESLGAFTDAPENLADLWTEAGA